MSASSSSRATKPAGDAAGQSGTAGQPGKTNAGATGMRTVYERRIEFCFQQRDLRRIITDAENSAWRLVACFPDSGLQYVVIFERET